MTAQAKTPRRRRVERPPAAANGAASRNGHVAGGLSEFTETAQAADTLAKAIAYEERLADEALQVRGAAVKLTPALLLKLWPLLRRPIPAGFIKTTEAVKGKPYESTGVESVQVLIDRMDHVLTPLWWRERVEYLHDGRVAEVTIEIGPSGGSLYERASRGGVNQGSTEGNVHKGSYTNAAKRAIAKVGPGHEIYINATDFDPDVDEQAAQAQAAFLDKDAPGERGRKLSDEEVKRLETAVAVAGLDGQPLKLKLTAFGVKRLADLDIEQALAVYDWCRQAAMGADGDV